MPEKAPSAASADAAWSRAAAMTRTIAESARKGTATTATTTTTTTTTTTGALKLGKEAAQTVYETEDAIVGNSSENESEAAQKSATSSEGDVFWHVEEFAEDHEQKARDTVLGRVGIAMDPSQVARLEREASKHWDIFYKRNTTNFFKDRHYLTKAFPVLREKLESGERCKLVEVGCGVGNAILPLAEAYENCSGFGVDFAPKAIDLLNARAHPRCRGFVNDITSPEPLPPDVQNADIASLLFVLSAVDPPRMREAVAKVVKCIRPGGFLLFRDYAELDHAQVRFSPEQRLGLNHYVRHDGTRTFFFSLEGLAWLMETELGLECVEAGFIRRVVVNRQKDLRMRRIFVNAIFRVPEMRSG